MPQNTPPMVFLSHSWKDNQLTIPLPGNTWEKFDFNTFVDHRDIGSGQRIHDRISRALYRCDCVVALITRNSLRSREVHEELTRAHERKLPIFVIRSGDVAENELWPFLQDHPSLPADAGPRRTFTYDPAEPVPTTLDHLQRSLGPALQKWYNSPEFVRIRDYNLMIHDINRTLSNSITHRPFKFEMIRDVLQDIQNELRGVADGTYTANIGIDRNFLIRATSLFRNARAIYAVSHASVSTFWTLDELQESVDSYVDAQPPSTFRLFVFATAAQAHRHREILWRHCSRYGESGAVLMCSAESYDRLIDEFLTHPDHKSNVLHQDFGILDYGQHEDKFTIEAVLSRTSLHFREVIGQRYGAIMHNRFRQWLSRVGKVRAGEVEPCETATGPGTIMRLSQEIVQDALRWDEALQRLFPQASSDVHHLIFFKAADVSFERCLVELKRDLLGLPSAVRPSAVWIGRARPRSASEPAVHPVDVSDVSARFPYLMAVRLPSTAALREYYTDIQHADVRRRFYCEFDDRLKALVSLMQELPAQGRIALFNAIEVIVGGYLARADYGRIESPLPIRTLELGAESESSARAGRERRGSVQRLRLLLGRGWAYSDAAAAMWDALNRDLAEVVEVKPESILSLQQLSAADNRLETADCILAYLSKASLEDAHVREELTRADELGIRILPVRSDDILAAEIPTFLADALYLRPAANASDLPEFIHRVEKVVQELGKNRRFLLLTQQQRKLVDVTRTLRRRVDTQGFKAELITDILTDAQREIDGIIGGSYTADLGLEYSFLQRAGALFRQAAEVYAVSYDLISTFWTSRHLHDQAVGYLRRHQRNAVRLFVFDTPTGAHSYRNILQKHYDQYGEGGAVLVCSSERYRELLDEVGASGRDDIERDFAVLAFRQETGSAVTVVATLERTTLTFDDHEGGARSWMDVDRFVTLMQELKKVARSTFSEHYRIARWGSEFSSDDHRWAECLREMFGSEGDVMHLVFMVSSQEAAQATEVALSRMTEGVTGVGDSWLGARRVEVVADRSSGGMLDTESEVSYPFVLLKRFPGGHELETYYQHTWESTEGGNVQRTSMGNVTIAGTQSTALGDYIGVEKVSDIVTYPAIEFDREIDIASGNHPGSEVGPVHGFHG